MKTKELGDKLAVAAMRLLKESGGKLPSSDLVEKIEKSIKHLIPNVPDWTYETYSNGQPKWLITFRFQSIELVKAGFIRKEKRVWYLEDKGRDILEKKSEDEIIDIAAKEYAKWSKENKSPNKLNNEYEDIPQSDSLPAPYIKNYSDDAKNGIKDFINKIDAYEFQNLCAALLRSMGYYISEIASKKGGDGGVDIIAYRDPLGAKVPRLKVQVKHQQTNIAPKEVRELHGLLTEGEVGVFICNSEFSSSSRAFARTAHKHLRLIGQDDFIKLWCDFYPKMSEKEQSLLPLMEISFLDEKRIIEE